ncbi:DNA polymerase eta isoform X2 [Rhodamnia argentea]|uniref:DNA polymerase eta n=1 Tax=Rhodamnia argentea TaxID=178133 RepID=A0A8B8QTZ3_9MYRT|nr:DNA polymerase eta isoform X2 [Rhodamnia argentea]
MPVAKPVSSDGRVIAHIDMDCFYVQVEQRRQPELRGLPTAVVQYNSWKGGGLIAVSYEARKHGVKRSMRGDEAKEVCPQIRLVQVPVARGKADLNSYREAGSEVVSILARAGRCERASIDEVYLDLTDAAETMLAETPPESLEVIDDEALKSHILGLKHEDGSDMKENVKEWLCRSDADHRDKLLACGVLIVADLRMQVLQETQFTCSAGISHNKMLSKLASAMNKPAQQTVVPCLSVQGLLESLPIKKMKQLGGKLGSSLQSELGVNFVGDLLRFSEQKLQEYYGINTGTWLWNIARGISGEEVEGRLLPKSHGSGKTFPGPRALKMLPSVQHWLNELCEELSERLHIDLDQNRRIARTLSLHASAYMSSDSDSHKKFPSKSCPLRYGTIKIQEDAMNLFQAGLREYLGPFKVKMQGNKKSGWGITGLSVSASKISDIPSGTSSIMKYFQGQDQLCSPSKLAKDKLELENPCSFSEDESNSTLNVIEHMKLPEEEATIKNESSDLVSTEYKTSRNSLEVPFYSAMPSLEKADFSQETPLSFSGRESHLEPKLTELRSKVSGEESTFESGRPASEQQVKRNSLRDKGTPSLLRFFRRVDPSCSLQNEVLTQSFDNTNICSSSGPLLFFPQKTAFLFMGIA